MGPGQRESSGDSHREPAVWSTADQLLSIFLPMWNEEDYVERAVTAASGTCDLMVAAGEIGDYEIVIVDDASTDATPQIADGLAAQDHRVRVVHHARNRKLGGSIKSGLAASRGDVVLYTDADLPWDMGELRRALRVLRTYEVDMVSAYRLDRTGEGPLRTVYSFVYNGLISVLFKTRVRDINFSFKLMTRRVVDTVHPKSESSFIDAEIVVRARNAGFEILQIGVDYFPRTRGVSTLSSPAVIRALVRELLALRRELARP
ncbi:glycosyltransferase family 2 protein [Miniimonas arenae]|uniref:Glycosyltransferase family 2 protein n=1 Tax=Miniimonas arenae TaxID=676201 RepID=A0A5C5B7M1_9MICO|nr:MULTISPECIES: glycosyltransferase family 2 protein [Miniimonas]TNU72973.1 glycosyltransferase family 2 protein [Miniimonas arenae]